MKFNQRALNQSGFTIVETMVAIGISTIILVGLTSLIVFSTKNQRSFVSSDTSNVVNDLAVNNGKSVLLSIGAGADKGLCKIVKTNQLSGGVGMIYVELPAVSGTELADVWDESFPKNLWNKFNSSWCAPNNYTGCFKPNSTATIFGGGNSSVRSEVRVDLIPIESRSTPGSAFKQIPVPQGGNLRVNARDMSFLVRSTTRTYRSDTEYMDMTRYSVVWAGEVSCNYTITQGPLAGAQIRMNASAIGTGVTNRTLFSDTTTKSKAGEDYLSVKWDAPIITSREMTADGNIKVKSDGLKVGACIEKRFKCQKSSVNREYFPGILQRAFVMFNVNNGVIFSNTVKAIPNLCYAKPIDASSKICPKVSYAVSDVAANLDNPIVSYDGTRRGNAMTVSGMDSVCPQVCESNSDPDIQYNQIKANATNPLAARKNLYESVLFHQLQPLPGYVEADYSGEPLYCACCQDKQCQGSGNRYGSCDSVGLEAGDARLPECEVEAATPADLSSPSPYSSHIGAAPLAPNSCVSLNHSGFVLETTPCNQQLPSTCFQSGHFKISKDPFGVVVSGSYLQSSDNCYLMGREIINNVNGLLPRSGALPPVTNGNYDYINTINTGIFLAPQTPDQWMSFINMANSPFLAMPRSWIGLRTDENANLYSRFPITTSTPGSYSGYYEQSRYEFYKDVSNGLTVGAQDALILLHSRTFYGLAPSSSNQANPWPVICQSKTTKQFFISASSTSNISNAKNICLSENGYFNVPTTPLQWTKLMLDLQPNDIYYAFPKTDVIKGAWTALKKTGADPYDDASWAHMESFSLPASGITDRTGVEKFIAPTQSVCVNGTDLQIVSGAYSCPGSYVGDAIGVVYLNQFLLKASALPSNEVYVFKKPETLESSTKTDKDCVNAGGAVFAITPTSKICKFTAVSCPGGWSSYLNWSQTDINTNVTGGTCKLAGVDKPVGCATTNHAFANTAIETCAPFKLFGVNCVADVPLQATIRAMGCH